MKNLKHKESQEPLVQQFRELQAAVHDFISLDGKAKARWADIESVYQYYIKYLWRGQGYYHDFEGEILGYLQEHGEATTKLVLQRFRHEIVKTVAHYRQSSKFYDSLKHQDFVRLATRHYKRCIEFNCTALSEFLKDGCATIKELVLDEGKSAYGNLKSLQETLQKCDIYFNSMDEYYDAINQNIKKVEGLSRHARFTIFDYKLFVIQLQRHKVIIDMFVDAQNASTEPTIDTGYGMIEPNSGPVNYFTEEVITRVFSLCDGKQFVTSTVDDYQKIFNLQIPGHPLAVRKGEKQRAYYLIYRLGGLIHENRRRQWEMALLQMLNLDCEVYSKKYKEAESITQGEKSQELVESLNQIIKKHKPE